MKKSRFCLCKVKRLMIFLGNTVLDGAAASPFSRPKAGSSPQGEPESLTRVACHKPNISEPAQYRNDATPQQ